MKTEKKQKVWNYLSKIEVGDRPVTDFVTINDVDEYLDWDTLAALIYDNGAFDREICHYSNAIKYLAENDPSLHESLQIAHEYGYTVDALSSETLASLLASHYARMEWDDMKDEVSDFLDSIEWDEDEDED